MFFNCLLIHRKIHISHYHAILNVYVFAIFSNEIRFYLNNESIQCGQRRLRNATVLKIRDYIVLMGGDASIMEFKSINLNFMHHVYSRLL